MIVNCHCQTSPKPEKKAGGGGKVANIITASLFLLVPKCAMCWAAYLGLFGLAGFPGLTYRRWFLPAAAFLFCITLGRMLWLAMMNRKYLAFAVTIIAAVLAGWQKWTGAQSSFGLIALGLMGFAWLIGSRDALSRFRPMRRLAE